MNFFDAPPNQLERWFHEMDRQHLIVCFLLAARNQDRAVFEHLIDEVAEMDSVLGGEISFMLFRQPAEGAAPERGRPERRLPRVIDGATDGELSTERRMRNIVVRSSQRAIPDLCRQFDVSFDHLPAMVVLAKGVREPYVFSLGDQVNYTEILTFTRQLAAILHDSQAIVSSEMQMKREIKAIEDRFRRIDQRHQKIEYAVKGFAKKHALPTELVKAFLLALRAGRTDISFQETAVAASVTPNALSDDRVAKIEKLLAEVREITDDLPAITRTPEVDVIAIVNRQAERSRDVLERLQRLRAENGHRNRAVRSHERFTFNMQDIADRTNMWIDIAEKVHRYWPTAAAFLRPFIGA
jgi:hypothetical protein